MEEMDANSVSSSSNSSFKPSLDLKRLGSAVRVRKDQTSSLKYRAIDRREDKTIWDQVKDFSKRLVDKLFETSGKVPKEIESLGKEKYDRGRNPGWIENAVSEFESTDLKVLMQIYHGKKKDSVASTCAFLVKLSNMPEEKNGNPAYILEHFGLWDNSELGLTMTIPSELLDRSKPRSVEEEADFKIGVNLFVAGVVIYGLLKLDRLDKVSASENIRSANKAIRAEKLAILADRLDEALSASKGTPKVVEKKKSTKKMSASGVEFKSPRSSNLTSLLDQAAKEDKTADMDSLRDMLASQGALIESLLKENKRLQEELVAGSKKPQGDSGVAEDKAAAFAKLASVKLQNKRGKSYINNMDFDDVDTDLDGMSELSVGTTSSKTSVMGTVSAMSELERSARQSIFSSSRVSTSRAPAPWSRLVSRLSDNNGIYVCDCQGNLFRMIQDAKTKSTKAYDVQFSLTLEYPLWATKQEIETDETCLITQRWPQNWIQMKMFFEEQLQILERDNDEEHKRTRAMSFYDPVERYKTVKQFFRTLKDIAKSTVGLKEEPSHPKHIQVFALISHFVYLMWTSAMVTSQTAVLTEDPMGIWIRHYDTKMATVQGKVDFPMKMAVVWLGYGCKGRCKRSGMCPGFCLNCNADAVGDSIKGSKLGSKGSTKERFAAWKKEMISRDPQAKVTFAEFTKNGPKLDKSVSKREGLTEEDYYDWLEENQSLFRLDIPSHYVN